MPIILDLGVAEYKKIGPESSPGTVVYSLSGNVERPGNYELPLGTTLRELIYDVGGGIPNGRQLKAIIPGGSSVPVFTPDQIDTPADFDSIQAAGSFLGSAAIIVVDDRACMVQLALRAEKFYMHESCGKCTPCREGTRWMVSLLEKIESGRAEHSDLDLLRNVCDRVEGRSLCALGDFAVWPVRSYIDKYRAEFEAHIDEGGCPTAASRRSKESWPRSTCTATCRSPRCPHEPCPGAVTRCKDMCAAGPVPGTGLSDEACAGNGHRHRRRARGAGRRRALGLVETALAAGIEIPVFCYEPRLGAPVGACRMCLVEVEGMPKLQAGCTLTATDGMVVKTAQTSKLAADGQSSTLEFILVNHPLDCPVCDKGGECPLQDLTFRWGPPVTRNTFPKRTFEKPIPISPTIALDRERCILCYRCTRFSSDVAEDDQLVARERGSQSIIATFEDQPYRAPFSGNVIELCPVGALTSTQYRFEARPWEIQDVPTVCGLCPVGCNIEATTREGKIKRIGSRNHPEIDEGWLCDKGRFGFTHLRAGDRVVDPSRKVGVRRYETLSWDAALDEAEEMLRAGGANIVTALSGSETVEQAYALGKLLRQGLGAHCAVMPEDVSPALDAFRLPLSAIRDAELIVILGDDPVVERAPVVDLWIKAARRAGAEVVESEIGEPGGGLARVRDELGDRIRSTERTILIWSGPGGNGGATIAGLAAELGLAEKPGSGAFHLPETANGRGVADGWAAAADGDDADPEPIELLIVSGDEAAANPDVRALAERAERVLAISMFRTPVAGWADLVLPGTSYLERDGTYVNLEGRLQRLRRAVIPPCPDELAWIAKLAERFDVELSPHPPQVFAELSERCYGGIDYPAIGELAELPQRAARPPTSHAPPKAPQSARAARACASSATARSSRARPIERIPELQFQRPGSEIELSADDAKKIGREAGSTVNVRSNGTSVELRARVNKDLVKGVARIPVEHAQGLGTHVEVST